MIVGLGGYNSRNPCAVLFGNEALTANEVTIDDNLAGKIRVASFDPAVDHCNLDALSSGDLV